MVPWNGCYSRSRSWSPTRYGTVGTQSESRSPPPTVSGCWLSATTPSINRPPPSSAATLPTGVWGCTSSPASAPPTGGSSTAAASTPGGASTTPASKHATPSCGRRPVRGDRLADLRLKSQLGRDIGPVDRHPGDRERARGTYRSHALRTSQELVPRLPTFARSVGDGLLAGGEGVTVGPGA